MEKLFFINGGPLKREIRITKESLVIEILNLEVLNKGALVAKFNAKMHKLGGLIIRECTLFESNGKKWINLPSKQYEKDGKTKYFSYLAYEDRAMDEKFKEKIMSAALEQLKKQGSEKQQEEIIEDVGDLPF